MTKEETLIAAVEAAIAEYRKPAEPPKPARIVVPSGGNVQAVLDGTDVPVIELEPGGRYAGIKFTRPVRLECHRAHVHGDGVPAYYVPPGLNSGDVHLVDPLGSADFQAVFQLGDNGPSQNRLDLVPRRITLERPVVAEHHGLLAKNGIENNAADVLILEPDLRGIFWNTTDRETHGIITINTPGGLRVVGGYVEAGSSPLFTGGDAIDIPDTDIADIVYEGVTSTRPASWQTDGVNRHVKNGVEFKNVTRALVARCAISNVYGPYQKGFACMLTPKVDGRVVDVEFRENVIDRVGGGWNILGRNPTGLDPTRTDNIRIIGNTVTIDKVAYGPSAFGWPFLLSMGPGRILIEGNTIQHNGNAFVYVDDLQRIASLIVRGNTFNAGSYGIRTPAGNNGDKWRDVFDELIVIGNTISGASSVFRRNFPENTYV